MLVLRGGSAKFVVNMSMAERLSEASIKNRIELCHLKEELCRLEKEKKNELRMHDNETHRFKARRNKRNLYGERTSTDASDVKMYETHNPGFCYRRNGEHKNPPIVAQTPALDFEKLHTLLFTDGEVDIDKVLCLHLLSTHRTETLKPPGGLKRPSKDKSPLERLIERSKKHKGEDKLISRLPTYIIDISSRPNSENSSQDPPQQNSDVLIRDGRLASRLIVNQKILELVEIVLGTLEDSNVEKMRRLLDLGSDMNHLRKIFQKPKIQEFIVSLQGYPLITSCESYTLTQRFKVQPIFLEIRTTTGILENLLNQIRWNILQFPSRTKWKSSIDQSSLDIEAIEEELSSSALGQQTVLGKIEERVLKTDIFTNKDKRPESSRKGYRRDVKSRGSDSDTESVSSVGTSSVSNFSASGTTPMKKQDRKISALKRELFQTPMTVYEDDRELNSAACLAAVTKEMLPPSSHESSLLSDDCVDMRSCIKKTTCPACMEKWRTPLPSPKTPRLMRCCSPKSFDHHPLVKTDSVNRLSAVIQNELYILNSYDRKYSGEYRLPRMSTSSRITENVQKEAFFDSIDLDAHHLDKIKQEIREKETQKKLEKFLND